MAIIANASFIPSVKLHNGFVDLEQSVFGSKWVKCQFWRKPSEDAFSGSIMILMTKLDL